MRMNLWFGAAIALAACGGDESGPKAIAMLTGLMGGTVTGTATFEQGAGESSPESVTVHFELDGCVFGKSYPVHIHTGSDCTDATTQGGHWDMMRGENIPNIICTGTIGTETYNRGASQPALMWSVGGDATTNIIGHTIVVHDPDVNATRIACGPITAL